MYFPDPSMAGPDGVVMVGGELNRDTLFEAYSRGIFPWPHDGMPLLWFSPARRGVLDFAKLHVPRSLVKFRKRCLWKFTKDQAFKQVMEGCAQAERPDEKGTWITPAMIAAYVDFHKAGLAHSVECWDESGALIGGFYGVEVGGVFSGESMFYLKPNASKLCWLWLIEDLKSRGQTWMDIQMVTPHSRAWGGKYIARAEYLKRLRVGGAAR
jgi:leucyl/phenylalanyl-tRNA---protein transferase